MKYYSDKLNKFFDTEDECVKAEADQKNAKNAYEVEKSNLKLKAAQADENLVKAQENLEKAYQEVEAWHKEYLIKRKEYLAPYQEKVNDALKARNEAKKNLNSFICGDDYNWVYFPFWF